MPNTETIDIRSNVLLELKLLKRSIADFSSMILFLFTVANADPLTTGNLLPNAGDGVDWGSTSTEQINPGGSGTVANGATLNGFDVTCSASQANCGYKYSVGGDFEVTGTATLSVDDIALTNNNITQEMLDNLSLIHI